MPYNVCDVTAAAVIIQQRPFLIVCFDFQLGTVFV